MEGGSVVAKPQLKKSGVLAVRVRAVYLVVIEGNQRSVRVSYSVLRALHYALRGAQDGSGGYFQ